MTQNYNKIKKLKDASLVIVLALISIIMVFPLLYVAVISLSNIDSFSKNVFSFLWDPQFSNYVNAWHKASFAQYGWNTIVVMAFALTMIVLTSSMCAYAVRRFRFKEIGLVYYFLIAGMFVPIQAVILPLFKTLKTFGLLNNLFGLAVVYTALQLPLSMMMFAGYYKSIPKELEEAATIDGCGPMKAFWLVIFPLCKTTIVTVAILCGLTIWRDFFIPLVLITETSKKTLGVGLLSFVDEFTMDWTKMCAAMIMQTAPIVALFLFLQRYFIGGAVAGAVKS